MNAGPHMFSRKPIFCPQMRTHNHRRSIYVPAHFPMFVPGVMFIFLAGAAVGDTLCISIFFNLSFYLFGWWWGLFFLFLESNEKHIPVKSFRQHEINDRVQYVVLIYHHIAQP